MFKLATFCLSLLTLSLNAQAARLEVVMDEKMKDLIRSETIKLVYESTEQKFGCWINKAFDSRPVFTIKKINPNVINTIEPQIQRCSSKLVTIYFKAKHNRPRVEDLGNSSLKTSHQMNEVRLAVSPDATLNPTIQLDCRVVAAYTPESMSPMNQVSCFTPDPSFHPDSSNVVLRFNFR